MYERNIVLCASDAQITLYICFILVKLKNCYQLTENFVVTFNLFEINRASIRHVRLNNYRNCNSTPSYSIRCESGNVNYKKNSFIQQNKNYILKLNCKSKFVQKKKVKLLIRATFIEHLSHLLEDRSCITASKLSLDSCYYVANGKKRNKNTTPSTQHF